MIIVTLKQHNCDDTYDNLCMKLRHFDVISEQTMFVCIWVDFVMLVVSQKKIILKLLDEKF